VSRYIEKTEVLRGPDDLRRLEPSEFEQIRELAHRTFGLDLKPGKEELVEARLRRLVRTAGARSFHEYYRRVVADNTGVSLAAMIDALTTNHTSFLREPEHFEYLKQKIFPRLASRNTIEVWSAACSTGEEVWTLACLLNDTFPGTAVRLLASDISTKVLRLAEQGLFPSDRCAALPQSWLSRYFSPEPAAYRVQARVRKQAEFRRINLVEPFSFPHRFPVIFCRNVMIYFDRSTQSRVVERLSACLEPGGYLFVGHAESLTRASHDLEYVRPAIYRKPTRGQESKWTRS